MTYMVMMKYLFQNGLFVWGIELKRKIKGNITVCMFPKKKIEKSLNIFKNVATKANLQCSPSKGVKNIIDPEDVK